MLPVLGKKTVLECCMKEGLIGSSYVCPKCGKRMEYRERTGHLEFRAPALRVVVGLQLRNTTRQIGNFSKFGGEVPDSTNSSNFCGGFK
ncbi:hypothetical protein TNCV_2863611 [Trichonephila clavipes]|nr:hypothetical protein TNCV_2863611 [Trichonephila clavipes]